ncbi:MAG: alpha/beta hydrolase [Anaerolineaceae bacterium]|nr:alpha/beta hydrolase [Anaerolineaceae bacterium]
MEIAALIVVCLFEITFASYCIITRSDQAKTRSIARISVFIAFGILILTSIVQWGFRWYAFAALLLVLAILGTIALLQKNRSSKVYRKSRIIGNAVGMIFLAALTLVPAFIFPQFTPLQPTGKYEVETTVNTYTDVNRVETYSDKKEGRKITVQYWYPKTADGTFPLIIFSHGSFGLRTSNLSLYRELASNGYVVCSIDHTYQSIYSTDVDGHTIFLDGGFMREVAAEDAHTNKQQSYEYYQKWLAVRAGDISFVIDHILARSNNAATETVFRLVDPSKIGLMGHSLGGSAVLHVGRMRKDISAAMALEAPFMGDIVGVENGEFVWNKETYPVPVLNIYSDSSWSHLGEWSQYAENAKLLTDKDAIAYNVYLQGAGHLNLTDLALTSPFLTQILSGQKASRDPKYYLTAINQLTLEFFDHYLKDKGVFDPQPKY